MIRTPPAGLAHAKSVVVAPALCVPAMEAALPGFKDMPEVFATAKMVAFIELTCIEALMPYLAAHERTLGTAMKVTHCAATPVGMRVTARVKLLSMDGRRCLFNVECHDEKELIGAGEHERAVVDLARFLGRLEGKSGAFAAARNDGPAPAGDNRR